MDKVWLPERSLHRGDVVGFHFDPTHFVTADLMTVTASNSGGAAVSDGYPASVTLSPSDCTVGDNDETYLHTTTELFKFANGKPIAWETEIQFAEANTNDANIFAGLLDAVGANALVDAGAGMKTTASGMGFYKVDGGTTWNLYFSVGTSQTLVELTAANSLDKLVKTAGGSANQVLAGTVHTESTGFLTANYFIDGVHVYQVKDFAIGTPTDMDFGWGVKNGDTNAESLEVFESYCWQKK